MSKENIMSGGLLRLAGNICSPSGRGGRLAVLIYHRVLEAPDPLLPGDVDVMTFDCHMRWLKEQFNVVSLSDACELLKKGCLPARAACVTFDDGYRDNVERALPILKKWSLKATFFISTGFLRGGRMWNDTVIESIRRAPEELDLGTIGLGAWRLYSDQKRLEAIRSIIGQIKHLSPPQRSQKTDEIANIVECDLPDDLMMTEEHVKALSDDSMDVGAHTISHPILSSVDEVQARREIEGGRDDIRSITGHGPKLFAYPNGRPGIDYRTEHVKMVRAAGFDAAVSTSAGAASSKTDLYQLPRFTPWDKTPFRFKMRLVRNYFHRATVAA